MKQIDLYWFTLMYAALNNNKNIHYIYNKIDDIIFKGVLINDIKMNIYISDTNYDLNKVTKDINNYLDNTGDCVKLFSYSNEEKNKFIDFFVEKIENYDTKKIVKNILSYDNLIDGQKIIGRIDYNLVWKYTSDLNIFLSKLYNSKYYPLGISEKTKIIIDRPNEYLSITLDKL